MSLRLKIVNFIRRQLMLPVVGAHAGDTAARAVVSSVLDEVYREPWQGKPSPLPMPTAPEWDRLPISTIPSLLARVTSARTLRDWLLADAVPTAVQALIVARLQEVANEWTET